MYILGISGGLGHDAAACLVKDGKIVAMVEEERLIRQKHARHSAPIQSVVYCLEQQGITLSDVDILALGWTPVANATRPIVKQLFEHPFLKKHRKPVVIPVDHHIAHAAAAYYCSGVQEAVILVMDGQSELGIATTQGYAKDAQIKLLRNLPLSQSLGFFYQAVTTFLGFGYGEEGKVMGLASYGQPIYEMKPIRLTNDGYHIEMPLSEDPLGYRHRSVMEFWTSWFAKNFGVNSALGYKYNTASSRASIDFELTKWHKDIAASAQFALESVVVHTIRRLFEETGCRNVVIAGGVGLNCSVNGRVLQMREVENLYVFPASGDAGTSAGAALSVYFSTHPKAYRPEKLEHAYFGPSFSSDDITITLTRLGLEYELLDNVGLRTAELLCSGKVVGWFQGRMEIGPRALGGRSILAIPSSRYMYDRVNRIKGRENWRPLAPSILRERVNDFVENAGFSDFMLTASQVSSDKKQYIPAVVHVDGSCRPQAVAHTTNKAYWEVINAVGQITDIPVILNTSFNLQGEPIVCNPLDAIRTFYSSELDALILGDFIVHKPSSSRF